MFTILSWACFGLIAGGIAKLLTPGPDPQGCLPTIAIGVAGSFVGGAIHWLLTGGHDSITPAGLGMSIIGGVVVCVLWRKFGNKIQ